MVPWPHMALLLSVCGDGIYGSTFFPSWLPSQVPSPVAMPAPSLLLPLPPLAMQYKTCVPVNVDMRTAVNSWPHLLPYKELVVMPDGSLVRLLPARVLGTGGFSKVVLGTWLGRGAAVAVKMPGNEATMYGQPGQTLAKDEWYEDAFLPELRALQTAGPHEYLLMVSWREGASTCDSYMPYRFHGAIVCWTDSYVGPVQPSAPWFKLTADTSNPHVSCTSICV